MAGIDQVGVRQAPRQTSHKSLAGHLAKAVSKPATRCAIPRLGPGPRQPEGRRQDRRRDLQVGQRVDVQGITHRQGFAGVIKLTISRPTAHPRQHRSRIQARLDRQNTEPCARISRQRMPATSATCAGTI